MSKFVNTNRSLSIFVLFFLLSFFIVNRVYSADSSPSAKIFINSSQSPVSVSCGSTVEVKLTCSPLAYPQVGEGYGDWSCGPIAVSSTVPVTCIKNIALTIPSKVYTFSGYCDDGRNTSYKSNTASCIGTPTPTPTPTGGGGGGTPTPTPTSTPTPTPTATRNASCTSISFPSTVLRNSTFSGSVTMLNNGTAQWTSPNYLLGDAGTQTSPYTSTWNLYRVSLPSTPINNNQSATFNFSATAPDKKGTYTFQWRMLQENVAWFGATCSQNISVVDSLPNSASCVSVSAPNSVEKGKTFSAIVTVKNTGTKTWDSISPSPHQLISDSPVNNNVWGVQLVGLPTATVAPNANSAFTFTATAPSTTGTYAFNWKMIEQTVGLIPDAGNLCTKTIVVTPPNTVPTTSITSITPPNYCSGTGPGGTVNFTYADADGDSQDHYQVQVSTNSGFTSTVVDYTSTVPSTTYLISVPSYNTTYYVRVRVYDSRGGVSNWSNTSSFTTAKNAAPVVNYDWTPPELAIKRPITFNDKTTSSAPIQSWSWNFGCIGGTECDNPTMSVQNPTNQFKVEKTYNASLTVNDGTHTCSVTKALNFGGENKIPTWKEVSPR